MADEGLRGYGYKSGVLMHKMLGEMDEECERIVLPVSERKLVLELAHDKGGHLGTKKTRAKINKLFTWPGVGKDVVSYVGSCEVCAKVNKAGQKSAKLLERPVVSEPFRAVAID